MCSGATYLEGEFYAFIFLCLGDFFFGGGGVGILLGSPWR